MTMSNKSAFAVGLLITATVAQASDAQLERGRQAIHAMTGCYLVDYNYAETESLKEGYVRDSRVYDINQNKSVKEWIYAEDISPTRIRLQHILFATSLNGRLMDGSELKHTGEDWEYNAPFAYEFEKPLHWSVKDQRATPGLWTRRITSLDDGLRYQCAATWRLDTAYPEWNCANNYAPIPGRETRDMGRKDYQALMRSTRVMVYTESWLERQDNVKVIDDSYGKRTPLARELGKNWYVRLPDSECKSAQEFAEGGKPFWGVLREAWDEVLVGDRPFIEKAVSGSSRYSKIMWLEGEYEGRNLSDPSVRTAAKAAIQALIQDFRAN